VAPLEVDGQVVDPAGHAIKRDRLFQHEPLDFVGGASDGARPPTRKRHDEWNDDGAKEHLIP
jgi:hypothetical protein